MNIILGLVIIALGIFIVAKSDSFLSSFGSIDFFDQHLATSGGSRFGYKLIGLAVIFIGIMIFTNMIGGLLTWIFGPLLRYSNNLGPIQ